jgi:hypothetical protein
METTYHSKTCKTCGKTKPVTEFYINKFMSDGHLNACIECSREYQRENYFAKKGSYAMRISRLENQVEEIKSILANI